MNFFLKQFALSTACLFTSLVLFSQTRENFDSRPAVNSKQVLQWLESRCWQFSRFSVTKPAQSALAGDGSIISSIDGTACGLYTPVLRITGNFTLSFKYAFSAPSRENRSISIYLTNANNESIRLLDTIFITAAVSNTVFSYQKTMAATAGAYKVHVSYSGGHSRTALIIDELSIGATQAYANGCNQAPKALPDVVNGSGNRKATGNVTENDMDPEREKFSAYLISDSKDGRVELEENGRFSFTPDAGFTGSSTSFTYQACDEGYNQLCSDIVSVTLRFPDTVASEIKSLQATYTKNTVRLTWLSTKENTGNRFHIERSTNGINFEPAGDLNTSAVASLNEGFEYEDRVTEKFSRKNDLFYRVTLLDATGKHTSSKMVLVRVFQSKTLQTLSVSPNPAVNNIRVNLQLNQPAYIVMKLSTGNGEEVIRRSSKSGKGDNSFTLDGSEKLKKGIYMLEVIVNSNERMLMKLIKT